MIIIDNIKNIEVNRNDENKKNLVGMENDKRRKQEIRSGALDEAIKHWIPRYWIKKTCQGIVGKVI